MERHLVNSGAVLLKFWLHIGKAEQLRRFQERGRIPWKQWKITTEDWRNREKWPLYEAAVEEMLLRTGTPHAPWTIVESNCKWYARIKVLDTVIKAVEHRLKID
jgi:polyphosphate kinase 2 (PPK2 family)